MDPVPMILPKGIVRNTDEIYAALASFSVVPPEVLWGCWHVYTSTSRKLSDPTARRLENFWWHVVGSDRRSLSGVVLAKIYKEISVGPTFVPLLGPLNRHESPPAPSLSQHELDPRISSPQRPPSHDPSGQAEGAGAGGDTAKSPTRDKARSSTKAPLHPILKNSRGPSSSGPRPTARFVSPPDSGEESNADGQSSSSSVAVPGVTMRPPPPQAAGPKPERKAHHHAGKKFVAVTSSSRRRPVMARRQSSQSSTGSEVGSREGGGSGSSTTKYLASRQRNSPSIAEHPSDSQNSQSSTASFGQEDNPGAPSSKAAGKRPARIPPEIRSPYFENSNARSQAGGIATQRGPTTLDGRLSRRSESGSAISDTLRRPPVAGFVGQPDVDAGSRKMVRSESNREYTYSSRQQQAFAAAVPPPDFITSKVAGTTSVTAATSNVAVQGQFDFDVPTAATSTATEARDIPDQVMMASSRRSSTSLFAPTQPSPTPAAPLARSKSQLALLLELDKERQPNRHHKNGVGQAGKTARTDRET